MHAILIAMALVATPDFPGAIERDLQLQAPPRCTICHATDSGGVGTAVRPFAVYLRSRGLRPFDEGSLRNALSAAAGENHSSSGDGLSDIEALKVGQDPNGQSSATEPTPAFGCSSSGSVSLLTPLAALAWLFRRRESPRTSPSPKA
jgi:uncharacterized protein (TIGR03382 family)